MSSTSASAVTITLRNGATCVLRDGALTTGDTTFPLNTLVFAGLVADTSVPVAPGMPPAPAVALRLASGASYFLTPVEQADAGRLLQAIHAARPDLAQPAPGYRPGPGYPPPGYGYPPPYGAPAYPGYPPYATGQTETDRTLAGLCHLSVFFAPVILPLIIWLAMRQSHPYASQQAKQAFWFHLIVTALTFIAFIGFEALIFSTMFATASFSATPTAPPDPFTSFAPFGFVIVFWGVLAVVGLFNVIFSIIGAVQGFQGRPFHYPLLGWL